MQLGLDDVQHDPLQSARRGQDHRLADLIRELLHHRPRRLHQPFAQARLGRAPERHQARAERDGAVGAALNESVLLELGQ
ncbi:MAG: hypothetical protein ACR2MK_04350 [Solirubrobacteraceae bacterium]